MQDLVSITAFHALYRHKSLTSAAKSLGQPKSTLSRRLTQLESDLGHPLMKREGNKIAITKEGEVFYDYCCKFLALSAESYNALQHMNNHVSGELIIAAHSDLIRGWLSSVIDGFITQHPDVSIRLISQYDRGGEFEPDLVLWIDEWRETNWRKEVIGHRYCGIYAAPNYLAQHPTIQKPEDLIHHQWIDFCPKSTDGVWLLHTQQDSFFHATPTSRLKSDNPFVQLEALVNGRGIGLLPLGLVAGYSQAHPGRLTRCLPEWHSQASEISCYTPLGLVSHKTKTFIEEVKANRPPHWLKTKG